MDLRWQSLAKGTASFFHPGFRSSWPDIAPHEPEHFYQIFLRHAFHVVPLLRESRSYVMAELGPGDSIGTGLAALIAGADRYFALDVENLIDVERNLEIFDALVEMFAERRPPTNGGDFVHTFPRAESETFPAFLADNLSWSMAPSRLAAIRSDIKRQSGRHISVNVPWRADVIPPHSVDWLLTHAVLEHIDNVDAAYDCFRVWLKPGAVMSHLIDFFSHGLTKTWDGHWGIGDLVWTLTRGKRYWLINRLPLSEHQSHLEREGFTTVKSLLCEGEGGIGRAKFARRFRNIPESDAKTRMAFLVCMNGRPNIH